MRLLADTHILLWALLAPADIPNPAREAIADPANDLLVSAATFWEIAIKHALGRLTLPLDRLEALVAELGATALPIAQARHEGLTLVSTDAVLRRYDVALLPTAG